MSKSKPPANVVHMDVCELQNLKIKEQTQMISILEKELLNAREEMKHKDRVFEDFKVDAAKNLARAIYDGREAAAKAQNEGVGEANRLSKVVRELELQLFKERLKSKQLEDNQRKLVSQFSFTRQEDVALVTRELDQLKKNISKSLIERLKQ
ncbi:hypothetical protein BC830DRAFT_1113505 [Chytriomyces sp. MP71]|nr:hypothetical protein BC830DRAFT_1113505 [Chytriomyces sp. MP71]